MVIVIEAGKKHGCFVFQVCAENCQYLTTSHSNQLLRKLTCGADMRRKETRRRV
jgi:hypothetical protein